MKKIAAVVSLSLVSLSSFAQSAQTPVDVQVDLFDGNRLIVHVASEALRSPVDGLRPFLLRTGRMVSEVSCSETVTGGTTTRRMSTQQKFIGALIEFEPSAEQNGTISGRLTVQNTALSGYRDEPSGEGCKSRHAETTGLQPASLNVDVSTSAQTVVPIAGDTASSPASYKPRYTVRFTPVKE